MTYYFVANPGSNSPSLPFSSPTTWFKTFNENNSYRDTAWSPASVGSTIFNEVVTYGRSGTALGVPGPGDTAVILGSGTITGGGTVGELALDGSLVIAAGMVTNTSLLVGVDYTGSKYTAPIDPQTSLTTTIATSVFLDGAPSPTLQIYTTIFSAGQLSTAGSSGVVNTYVYPQTISPANGTIGGGTITVPQPSNYALISGSVLANSGTFADSTVAVSGLLSASLMTVLYGSTVDVRNGGNLQDGAMTLAAAQQTALSVDVGGTATLYGLGGVGLPAPLALVDAGNVLVDGGLLQSPGSYLEIGKGGAGTLAVTNHGTANTDFSGIFSQGTLLVYGPGALFQGGTNGAITDNGALSVTNAATLNGQSMIIGVGIGGTGEAAVTTGTLLLGGTLSVGAAGGIGALTLGAGAQAQVTGNAFAGFSQGASSQGTISLDGNTTTMAVLGSTEIGGNGSGALTLTNRSVLRVTGSIEFGSETIGPNIGVGNGSINGLMATANDVSVNNGFLSVGPTGLVTVGSHLSAGELGTGTIDVASGGAILGATGITIGGEGTGDLSVAAGAAVIAVPGGNFIAGESQGSEGNATVDGGLLTVADMTIGDRGDGSFSLAGGGTANVTNGLAVGDGQLGIGSATLIGPTSVMNIGTGLSVGGSGSGVMMIAGAEVNLLQGDISVGESLLGNGILTVNVGFLNARGNFDIGSSGTGAAAINLGAVVAGLDQISVGESAGGFGVLSLNAGVLQSQTMSLGSYGQATMLLTSKSLVTTVGNVAIADQATGLTQHADINQSTWQIGQDLAVGDKGSAQVTVENGGTVGVAGLLSIGGTAGAAGTVDATGSGSTVDFSSLVVGDGGSGTLLIQNGATSAPVNGQKGTVEIAAQAGSAGTVALSGASSLTGATLDVGGAGTTAGGSGMLSIDAGASVNVTDVTVFADGSVMLSGGTLTSSPVTVEAGGTIGGTGTIASDVTSEASILAGSGILDITGSVAGTGDVVLQNGADLWLGGSIGVAQTIDGLSTYQETLDLRSLAFTAGQMTTLASGDTLTIGNGSQSVALTMGNSASLAYRLGADAAGGTELTVACFAHGTRILTLQGEVAVEDLAVGDLVVTLSGRFRAVRWIGRRGYEGRLVAGNPLVLPVTIRAGALGVGLPRRDLTVSPMHALLLDGVLVPAAMLLDGNSIVQARDVDRIAYVHIELDGHDIVVAEGIPAESFRDDGNRGQFANAHTAPGGTGAVASCAPVVLGGDVVERLRHPGGLGEAGAPGALIGHVDTVSQEMISGWAVDLGIPDRGVTLEAMLGGHGVGRVVANWWRPDLARAGFGTGHHGFEFVPPEDVAAHEIAFRREADGAPLSAPGRLRAA